jgi:hypothetical protein
MDDVGIVVESSKGEPETAIAAEHGHRPYRLALLLIIQYIVIFFPVL